MSNYLKIGHNRVYFYNKEEELLFRGVVEIHDGNSLYIDTVDSEELDEMDDESREFDILYNDLMNEVFYYQNEILTTMLIIGDRKIEMYYKDGKLYSDELFKKEVKKFTKLLKEIE